METPQISFKQVVSRGCGLYVHKKIQYLNKNQAFRLNINK